MGTTAPVAHWEHGAPYEETRTMTSTGRILVVDDEPNVRLVFRTSLESVGHVVDEAADGEEALERLADSNFECVLLDLLMPGIGGMETLRRIRETGSGVPVVIVTAHGSIPDAVAAMKLGAIDFLTKPQTPESLRKVVAEVVLRHAEPAPQPSPLPGERGAHVAVVTVAGPLVDLTAAKRALNRRDFDQAANLLEQALDLDPESVEAQTLLGVLYESRGQDHAAYQAYKAALTLDHQYNPALDNLRRYCQRFGLDFENRAINPGAK
jgi:DNA-binding response OmpR family regulator